MPTSTSKDLGLVAAIIPGNTAPTNTSILWLDTNSTPAIKKYYDPTTGQWLPLIEIDNSNNGNTIKIDLGDQILFVSVNGNDYVAAKGDLSKCFMSISGAYNYAKTLSPSIVNKITIAVYPGTYVENVVMDADYVNIVSAVPQTQIYSPDLLNGVNFDNLKRRYLLVGTISINCKYASLKGIDVTSLIIKPYIVDGVDKKPILHIENLVAKKITNPVASGEVTGNFYDVHAESFLDSDTQTDLSGSFIMCGGNTAFRSGIATLSNNIWRGGIKNAYFERCYGGNGSLSGLGGYIYNSNIINSNFNNNCISTIEQCNLNMVNFGNTCIKTAINTIFHKITGGSDFMKDFTDVVMQDCLFGDNFGTNGTLSFVSGNFDNVTSSSAYSNGFASSRPFWGKMRGMFIRVTNINNSGVNLFTPNDQGVDRQPATIEHSTILHCTTGSSKTPIDGTVGYISYCKFNKDYSAVNALTSDSIACNIISEMMCNYVAVVCPLPTLFNLITSNFTNQNPIDFVFDYNMSVSRVGSNIEMTKPDGSVSIINIVGNNGGAASGTLTIHEETPIAGAYSFRLRTICGYDNTGAVAYSSSYTNKINASVTNYSRPTAWRPKDSTKYCILTQLNQVLYGKLTLENSSSQATDFPPTGTVQSTTTVVSSNIRLSFYSDAQLTIPVTLVNQTFNIFIKQRSTSNNNTITYNDSVFKISFVNISGSSAVLPNTYNNSVTVRNYDQNNNWTEYTTTSTYSLFPDNIIVDGNTGYKEYTTLEQYYSDRTGLPAGADYTLTGQTKANVDTDSDYAAPVVDNSLCPTDANTTNISFGTSLKTKNVTFTIGGTVIQPNFPSNPFDSGAGSILIVKRLPNQPTTLAADITTYYQGGVTTPGKIQVLITYNGVTAKFTINNNGGLQTIGTFINITSVNFSNF